MMKIRELHLNAMGSIYAGAPFTIVSAQGKDANTGVAGIGKSCHLSRSYRELEFPSIRLTQLVPRRQWKLQIYDWVFRGRIFQEHFFSKRLLVLNDPIGLASWICKRNHWVEEIEKASEQMSWIGTHTDKPNKQQAT